MWKWTFAHVKLTFKNFFQIVQNVNVHVLTPGRNGFIGSFFLSLIEKKYFVYFIIWMVTYISLFLWQLPVPEVRTKRSEFIQPQSPQRPPQVATISQSPFCDKQYYPGQWCRTATYYTRNSLSVHIYMYIYMAAAGLSESLSTAKSLDTPLFLTQEQNVLHLNLFL